MVEKVLPIDTSAPLSFKINHLKYQKVELTPLCQAQFTITQKVVITGLIAKEFTGKDSRTKSSKVTERINAKAFELLEHHPEGLHFSELRSKIEASDPSFHPKTVNGCVWKLVQRFPDKIYKPSKGLFRLLKYKSSELGTPK